MTNFPVRLPNPRRILVCTCLAALVQVARAGELLAPGDIVLTGRLMAPMVGDGVVRVDPVTGAQTLLATGAFNAFTFNFIAVDRDERLYGSRGTSPVSARIVRIDLATGAQGDLALGMNLWEPQGIAIDEAGDLLVTNKRMAIFPPSDAMFLRIDAKTGAQTVLAQNVFLARPKDIALDADGTAVVVDDTLYGALFRANPLTGAVTLISEDQTSSGLLFVSTLVALAPSGMIFVNGPTGNNGLVRVDPATGGQFTSLQGIPTITSMKSSLDGDIFLAVTAGLVLRFDPATETIVQTVTGGGLLLNIFDMAVVPAPVDPPLVTCTLETALLWPPDHELRDVGLGLSVKHDAPTTLSLAVYSDEGDLEPGSGNHAPDALDVAAGTLRLRAERSGHGDGRVYLIVATAADEFGNVGVGCCTVVVPKSESAASEAEVLLQAALAEGSCRRAGVLPRGFVPVGER
jgi:hypothetical protein